MINPGDTAFVLISAALVCLMTPGLAFFYGGLVSHKNVLTIIMQNYIAMGVVTVIWVVGGFSLAFGPDVGGVIGNLHYAFLNGVGFQPSAQYGGTIPFLAFFVFQLMFAVITPSLITGAVADRFNFKSYLLFLIVWSLLVYIPIAHWVWGGGFLAQLGVKDFAGGLVVHASAGAGALASVIFLGKRLEGEESVPHNIPYVALGTALLWFGWFGFNAGSELAANGVAATAFVNTDIAAALGMVTWLVIAWLHEKRPSVLGALVGAVAGLATITPASGYVQPWAAAIIGMAAAGVCYLAVLFKVKRGWDDALDCWAVHGVGGMLGTIALGVFAFAGVNGVDGLIYGNVHQFVVEVLAALGVFIYAFLVTFGALKVINLITPVRVNPDAEMEGLDICLHGECAYGTETLRSA